MISTRIPALFLAAIGVCCYAAQGAEGLSCPVIGTGERPALVFVGGGITDNTLQVARFGKEGEELETTDVLSGRNLEVAQLGNAVFLITAFEASGRGRVYAVNFDNGRMRCLAESTAVRCLRSLPSRNVSMLMEVQSRQSRIVLYELALDTLDLVPRHRLSRLEYQDEYVGFGTRMRMSPDLKHIAYVVPHSAGGISRWTTYTLKIVELSTKSVREFVPSVGVQIGSFSSFGRGVPPLVWLDNSRVLYQDMDTPEDAEVFDHDFKMLHRFKCVDIKTEETSECMAADIPLSLDGGSLNVDPLTGNIRFRDDWVLDLNAGSLRSAIRPFTIESFPASRRTEIRAGSAVIYDGPSRCVSKVVAPSGEHIAYSLRPWASHSLFVELYAKTKAMAQPVKVTEGCYLPVRPIGWIE